MHRFFVLLSKNSFFQATLGEQIGIAGKHLKNTPERDNGQKPRALSKKQKIALIEQTIF